VLAPLAYASIDIPRCRSVLFPFIQHYFTIGGGDSRPDVNYTSIKAAMLTRWPDRIYTVVEPQLIVDHERADRIGATAGSGGRVIPHPSVGGLGPARDRPAWRRPCRRSLTGT